MLEDILIDNLVELLLSLILTFQIAAFTFLWRRLENVREETDKNSESINTILNRIFGIEKDPTDDGHIMETEKRFEDFGKQLEQIAERQEEACKQRKKEHRKVDAKISSIMRVLSEEEKIDVEKSDFSK